MPLHTLRQFLDFVFKDAMIRKFSFAKVGSCELNENHGSLLAEWWVRIMMKQPKAGVVSFVIKCQLHRIQNIELCQLL